MLEIEIDGKCHLVLVDSGDSLSVMKPGISSSELQATQTAARGITGNKLKATGTQYITFWEGKRNFKHEFLIVPLDVEFSGILGMDVLNEWGKGLMYRPAPLVQGRTSHQLSGQEAEWSTLLNRQPQAVRKVSDRDRPDHP